ncbi:MAG: Methionine aminopeptidase [Herbinix sp.]|jgi:methionyl aminopeptidase|nr:Methionine aminopeptidase [Herbinix sp.]
MIAKLERNDPCWCGSGKKYKVCHSNTDERINRYRQIGCVVPPRKILKSAEQIQGIRESGKVNIKVLDYIAEQIHIGMSTEDINTLVNHKMKELGGIPATLGFEGYPKSVCTSINGEVCHGIPSDKVILKDGDIINVDVTTIFNGYFADSSRMFCLGAVSDERKQLVEAAKKAIDIGLEQAKSWNFLGDIGQAIDDFTRSKGYSVVREIGGHGIGIEFHEEPYVSYVSQKGTEMLLVPGMVFTIEPMINMGKADVVLNEENGWTISTKDGKDSAQWEVTVLITESGYEILAY